LGNKLLTYFTPTYNRAHTLPKLYESLKNQTKKDFIWLIVDDGSKDNTRELVEQWQSEGVVEIQYVLKENGGKHTAIDMSNQVCTTAYINCIDSDDYLSIDSTEVLYKYLDEVSKDGSLCGIVARKAHFSGEPFNKSFPNETEKMYFKELATKYNHVQDTNLIFKTALVKNYHFPIFEEERFVTESVFYNQFMLDYKMLAIPELLYLAEYQADGYTKQGMRLFFKNPQGYLYALKQNARIAIMEHVGVVNKLKAVAKYYGWKKALKLTEKYKKDNKIKFPYNIIGWGLSIKSAKSYKKALSENLGNIEEKRVGV